MRLSFLGRRSQAETDSQAVADTSIDPKKNRQPMRNHWETPLWDFAVRVYARDEVEITCLRLQDEYHASVDIILWCCWLDAENINISKDALDDVLISIDTVSQSTLLKLRSVRRHIREAEAFTEDQSSVINKQLLNAELMIEKVLLFRLQALTRKFVEVMRDVNSPLTLEYYLEFLGIPDAANLSELLADLCSNGSAMAELN